MYRGAQVKTKKTNPAPIAGIKVVRQQKTEQEIADFLEALHSYPEQFAHNPLLSFEQHLFSIAAENNLPAKQ